MITPVFQEPWSLAPDLPELNDDEAHLWRASLVVGDASVDACVQTLSADERTRADRFRFEVHRRRFVVGRGLLRRLLGRYLDRGPADIEFAYGRHGKPSLASRHSERTVFFNVSQSDDVMLCGITSMSEIGVDVERVRAISEWPEIAERTFLHDSAKIPPATLEDFYREWTRHEARVKATGDGLGGRPDRNRQWQMHSFLLADDFVAAVALPEGVRHITFWNADVASSYQAATDRTNATHSSPGAMNS